MTAIYTDVHLCLLVVIQKYVTKYGLHKCMMIYRTLKKLTLFSHIIASLSALKSFQ